MTDIISTKQAAEKLGMKGRELGAFVRTHPQFAPERRDGFPPFYTGDLVARIDNFRSGVKAGKVCDACGASKEKPADIDPDYEAAKDAHASTAPAKPEGGGE